MDCVGKITAMARDYDSSQILLTLSLEKAPADELYKMKELDQLSVCIKKYRKKRSLDANAYLWVLCTKIAEILQSSKDEVYESMLQKYGCLYRDDGGYITVTIKSGIDIARLPGHWKRYKDNGKFVSYLMIKGSSEYDTAEMARFLDQIVEEAKELGIETLTPDELERIKQQWTGSS